MWSLSFREVDLLIAGFIGPRQPFGRDALDRLMRRFPDLRAPVSKETRHA